MHIEFDRNTCVGMFYCVDEWEAFQKDRAGGTAALTESEEIRDSVFSRDVPEGEVRRAELAARVCPVNAIELYDDTGERIA